MRATAAKEEGERRAIKVKKNFFFSNYIQFSLLYPEPQINEHKPIQAAQIAALDDQGDPGSMQGRGQQEGCGR
jgi:hypothetical protein